MRMMWWRSTYEPTAYDDDWEDQPRQGAFYKWVLGVMLPAALLAYGVCTLVRQETDFGPDGGMTLRGLNALAYGTAWASAGVFLHCHYFWGNIYDQARWAVLGKIAGAAGFIAGLGFVIVRIVVLGMR